MGERALELQRRVTAVAELRELVGAMRALAAARLQQAQALLPSTRAYAQVIAGSLAQALPLVPAALEAASSPAPRARILFCAEHGFAGAFSRRVVEVGCRDARPDTQLFVVGARGMTQLAERRLDAAWVTPMATQASAVGAAAERIAEELYRRFSEGRLASVDVVFARCASGGNDDAAIVVETLLPVAPPAMAAQAVAPVTQVAPAVLLDEIAQEYFFAQLAHAAMESLTSENAARLAAMQSARLHVDERLEELTRVARRARQDETTDELLEIVTGALASTPAAR